MTKTLVAVILHDSGGPSSRGVGVLVCLFAVMPAVALACLSVHLNHFALIDDWVNLDQARGDFADNFRIHDSRRFNFFYRLSYWILARALAPEPWAFSLVNGLFVVVAAWQVYLLTRRLGGGAAGGILASWLFTLNLSTTENLFTLGKAEPRQLVFWLAALTLFARALDGRAHRRWWWEAPVMAAVTATAILFKEVALLLAVPLATFTLITCATWWGAPVGRWRRSATLAVACAVPLAAGAAWAARQGARAGSYARDVVTSQPLTLSDLEVALFRNDVVLTLMLLVGIVAGLLLLKSSRAPTGPIAIVLGQLVAVFAFYTMLRQPAPYHYYPCAAFGAILLGAGLFPAGPRSPLRSALSTGLVVVFLFYGVFWTAGGVSVLSAWSGLYDRLTTVVRAAKPPRVLFYHSGNVEVHVEAESAWAKIPHLPVEIGVLAPEGDPKEHVRSVRLRDLRPGDWVLEEFGVLENARLPFRDTGVTRLQEHALVEPTGGGLLPVRIVHQLEAGFRFPLRRFEPLPLDVGFLHWRVYEVTDVPRVLLERLDADHWMRERATLLVRPWMLKRVTLRFRAFVYAAPGSVYDNELTVRSGERTVARCPAKSQGISECSLDVASWGSHGPEEWVALDLIAAKVFSPQSLGLSAETRHLSFNFGPTWEAGSAALFEAGATAPYVRGR